MLAIVVREPTGVDARVWEEIRKPPFLYFLQSGLLPKGHPEVARRALELVRDGPRSGYDSTLRRALRERYEDRRKELVTRVEEERDPELREIREALGIALPKEP